jgi:hypothetical protein
MIREFCDECDMEIGRGDVRHYVTIEVDFHPGGKGIGGFVPGGRYTTRRAFHGECFVRWADKRGTVYLAANAVP